MVNGKGPIFQKIIIGISYLKFELKIGDNIFVVSDNHYNELISIRRIGSIAEIYIDEVEQNKLIFPSFGKGLEDELVNYLPLYRQVVERIKKYLILK